jgi:formate hydrogenlyase subunit 3/multisubunit Na+/H+ antiporter MnhD subunit
MNPLGWMILPPLVAAVPVFLLRRWRVVSAGLAIVACLAVATLALQVPNGTTLDLFGRELAMGPLVRLALAALALLGAGLIAIDSTNRPATGFRTVTLIGLAVITLALLVRSTAVTIFLGELAALALVWPVQEESGRTGSAALGYASLITIAMPCYLLAVWLIDLYVANPNETALLRVTVVLLALGFGLVLAMVPFHGWWPVVAETVSPSMAALVGVAFPVVSLTVMADLAVRYPWLSATPLAREMLVVGGLLSAVGGALLAATAGGPTSQRPQRLLAAAAIHDLGAVVLGIGLGRVDGTAGAVLDLAGRVVALVLMAAALDGLRRARLGQGGRWAGPVALTGLIFAGLSLSGIPLTGSFPGRWVIIRLAFQASPWPGLSLLVSQAVMALAFLGLLRDEVSFPAASGRPSGLSIGLVLLILLSLGLGLWPEWILAPTLQSLAALSSGG